MPGDSPICVCQRGMGNGPWAYAVLPARAACSPLGNWVFPQHFNPEPNGDDLPCLGFGECCLFSFFSPLLVPNRDHFRLWEGLGEMAVDSGK